MSPRVEDFKPCGACGGKLFPLVLCDTCGAATILHDAEQLDWAAACPDCGTFNPWQLICDQCHSRFPAPGANPEASLDRPPQPARPDVVDAGPPPAAAKGRLKRKVRGEFDTTGLLDMFKVLGLEQMRARALIDRGFNAIWKIARTSEAELARIPEVGPIAARKIFASFHLLKYAPPQRTKESIVQDEYECPLCACPTSAFATACVECGAAFEEEEMDEAIRKQFAEEGDAGLLTFFDGRLKERADDPNLHYARGLLLESLGRIDEASASLDRAASLAPDAKKIKVAQLRLQAKQAHKPEQAEKLRSTASSLLDDAAWDQEVARLDHLIAQVGSECPKCGATILDDADRCPECGALVGGRAEAVPEGEPAPVSTPELDTLVDDLLVGELEESLSPEELDGTKAAVLDWLIQELEESIRPDEPLLPAAKKEEPKEEGKEVPAAADDSPLAQSVSFVSEWMRGSKGLVSGMRPKKGPGGTIGRVNGLVNGEGRVNGLVNGLGRTNGLVNGFGRVNGLPTSQGRVNGLVGAQGRTNGFVNGTRFVRSGTRILPHAGPSRRVRYLAIASGTLAAILIFALLFIPIPGPTSPITIDGSFGDWTSVPMFDAASWASNPSVSILRYASLLDHNSLYLYATTRSGPFSDPAGYNGIYFLIDADGNASTGYAFDGIGADAVVDVFGDNHSVAGARLYSFPVNAELNWSRRQTVGSVDAAASAGGLELKVSTYDIDRFDAQAFRVSVYADDFRGASSRSLARLSEAQGAVLLDTEPLASTIGTGSTDLFQVHVRGLAIPPSVTWVVSNFTFTVTAGVTVSLSAQSVTLTQGQPTASITASVSAPGLSAGQAVEVDLTGAKSLVPVSLHARPVRAYVIAPPNGIRIDGLFADWLSRDVPDTDATPVINSDLDIARYGAATSNGTAFFHVQVAGILLAGTIPERLLRPLPGPANGSSGGGGSAILPRQTGEDLLRVYVDTNSSNPQGLTVDGISADYLVEIRGEGGRITSKTVYVWSGRWIRQPGVSVNAEKNETDIEASVALPSLNGTRMVIASSDWAGTGDDTLPVGAPAFAPSLRVGALSLASSRTMGFKGSTFFLRDIGPAISPSDCSAVKGLNTTAGNSNRTLTLTTGSRPCFFTDPETSPETISAGPWVSSMDLSTTPGTGLNITFAITQQDGSSPSLICWVNTSTTGGPDQPFDCQGPAVSISTNQRIRVRVEYVSGPSIDLAYDGSGMAQDSSITVHAPEFGDATVPSAIGAIVVFLFFNRRRRRVG